MLPSSLIQSSLSRFGSSGIRCIDNQPKVARCSATNVE
jgi:hypothetical protein